LNLEGFFCLGFNLKRGLLTLGGKIHSHIDFVWERILWVVREGLRINKVLKVSHCPNKRESQISGETLKKEKLLLFTKDNKLEKQEEEIIIILK